MLFHYIKIALRNLSKYKVQNIISIASLAIGITTLAVVQCFLCMFRKPAVFSQPYADRCYYMRIVCPDSAGIVYPYGYQIQSNEDNLLRKDGGMACVEKLYPLNSLSEGRWVWFNMDDGTRRQKVLDINAVFNDYPNYRGLRSAVTGNTVPMLKRNEVLMSKSLAEKVYGDINHIGSTISFMYNDMHNGEEKFEERFFTLADVFEDLPMTEEIRHDFLFSVYDNDEFVSKNVFATNYEVVLRKGCTAEQLRDEANTRLKPCNRTVEVIPLKDAPSHTVKMSGITRSIIWLAGSMILLSSLISFIRMQMQLLRMRKREFSLRKVNGASTWKLYLMLLIEHAMLVLASVVLALILTQWLKVFADTRLMSFISDWKWKWDGIFRFIIIIGLSILAVCAVIIALTLNYALSRNNTYSDNMRSSNSLFHKTMLVLQTVICTVFVSGTLSLLQFVKGMSELNHIPDNDKHYKECVYIRAYYVKDLINFRKEVEKCRFADRVIAYSEEFDEMFYEQNITLRQIVAKEQVFAIRNYVMPDTSFFDFYRMKINWLSKPSPDESYVLVNEYLYGLLQDAGVTDNGMMNTYDDRLLPVAGTFPAIPYSNSRSQSISIAVINPESSISYDQYILEPEKGKYQDLFSEANDLFRQYNPELVDTEVYNLRDNQGAEVTILDAMRGGSFILSGICLIICIMSIYSTLQLSIRARRKEVAIRKVNGARRGDVALLFGKLYITLAVICIIISVPIGVLFNSLVIQMGQGALEPDSLSALIPVTGGCLFTLLMIAITVWGNISRIMKLNPAEYIAKE